MEITKDDLSFLFRYVKKNLTDNHMEAEDLIYDAIAKYLTSPEKFKGESPLRHYLSAQARFIFLSNIRQKRGRREIRLKFPLEQEKVTEQVHFDARFEPHIQKCMDSMANVYSEAIYLRMEEKSLKEIASITNAKVNAIGVRVCNAKKHFKKHLGVNSMEEYRRVYE